MTFADCLSAIISIMVGCSGKHDDMRGGPTISRERGGSDMHCLVGLLIVRRSKGLDTNQVNPTCTDSKGKVCGKHVSMYVQNKIL